MSQAKALYHLQQIDLHLIANHKRLGEIETALADNSAVNSARQTVESIEKALTPLRARMRDLELEIQSNSEKSSATEDRLYGGKVKSPKELGEMQQEIASLKKRKSDLEDTLLELMMSIEEKEEELQAAQDTLTATIQTWEDQNADLLQEKEALEADNTVQQGRRENALQDINPENRKTYDTMRKRKANKPISPMEGKSCGVCGIEQTVAVEQEVTRNEALIQCINCGRILVDARILDMD